jgi:hypothetical protein
MSIHGSESTFPFLRMKIDTYHMITNLCDVTDYQSLQNWLDEYCEVGKHTCWHNYGPAEFSLYETEPVKILLMNAESVGYEGCQKVPSDTYLTWIRDRHPTPRQGAVLVTIIRDYIDLMQKNKPIPAYDRCRASECYKNERLLIDKMRGTIYMNARITSNDTKSSREDKGRIWSDIKEFASFRRRFIQVLKPKIVICAGASARDALFIENGAFPKSALQKESTFVIDNCILVLTRHLARFGGYAAMHEVGLKCAKLYCATFPEESRVAQLAG